MEKESEYDDGDQMAATHWEFNVRQENPEYDVVEAVAELEGRDSSELSPLYETIDHLVENLFSNPPPPRAQARLEFTYEGYRITLDQDGYATFMKVGDGG